METATLERTINVDFMDDGTPFDRLTGEVLDCNSSEVRAAVEAAGELPVTERFEVRDEDGAEWALEKLADIDGEIAYLEAKKAAVIKNVDVMIRDRRRRRDWWNFRFASSLIDFAKSTLTGKTKTRRFVHGTVSFRTSKGERTVLDPVAAEAFVRQWCPSRIRVKTLPVTLADIDEATRIANEATESTDFDRLSFVLGTGPRENVKIETGIGNQLESSK